jgi:DNA-binding beta-propeller fold protein YncE
MRVLLSGGDALMIARRLVLAGLAWLCTAVGALAFTGAPALALNGHVFSSSFASPGSGAGEVSSPAGVAVNSVTHDVYVADKGNRRIDEFSASGAFIRAWGWGVADGLPMFETCTISCEAGLSGSGVGQFTIPAFVAVDNSGGESAGDVYVGDLGDKLVTKFDASGNVISSWVTGGQLDGSTATDGPFELIVGIAVDDSGTLLVLDTDKTEMFEFAQEGSFTTDFEVSREDPSIAESSVITAGLAIDASGNIFKFDGDGDVEELASSGSDIGTLTKTNGTGSLATGLPPTDLAVESATGELYVDAGTEVEQYVFPGQGKVSETGSSACVFKPESAGCEPTGTFGKDVLRDGTGIGVDPSDGVVYVADAATGRIDVFVTPVIEGTWVSDVASSSATFDAEVNPLGSSTGYQLEYGTTTSYGQTLSGNVGEGRGDVLVSYHRQELSPGTLYHYRIVVHNGLGSFVGEDHTFTTQRAGGEELVLPDGRAWELVSPPNKNGALIEPPAQWGTIQAADDGSGITYPASESIGENPKGKALNPQVLSRRGPSGWESQNIEIEHALPAEGEQASGLFSFETEYRLFSPDLSEAVIEPPNPTKPLSPEASERTIYLRNDENGSYLPLVTSANTPLGTKFGGVDSYERSEDGLQFLAASPDLSHIVLESAYALTSEPASVPCTFFEQNAQENVVCSKNLYEWSAGRLKLVSILPTNSPASCKESLTLGPSIVGDSVVAHTVSNDGRWVVWSCGTPIKHEPIGLYVRDMVQGKTFQVGGQYALFQMMSSDGSKVFFLENGDLHEFDTQTGVQSDLTAAHGAGEANAGVDNAVLGASEDGSYVYFVATGALEPGAVSGGDNLYLLHENEGEWTTRYVATLSSDDEKSWLGTEGLAGHDEATSGEGLVNDLEDVSSRVSPDGRFLAFMSDRSLTGYDNLDASSGAPDEEVYLFDALSGKLACASCDPTGARPVGMPDNAPAPLVDRRGAWRGHWLAGSLPGWYQAENRPMYQPRYLSDGGRLFFDSPDALVPQDSNGLEDVYEYEPPAGAGTSESDDCTSASPTFSERSGGCVSLISSGTSGSESVFFDASEDGGDVFFATASRLTVADYDNGYDLYDAHACSAAVPCASVPVAPPACTTVDSCKAAPSAQPEIFGPAPSATFNGTGNVVEETKSAVKHKTKTKPKAKRKKAKKRKRKGKKADRSSRARRSMASRKIGG